MSQLIVFEKMHGIGNDFVLIDNRSQNIDITHEQVCKLGDRHKGIGFDQLLVVDHSEIESCHAAYRFFNPDGSQAEQCGNGQRCISKYLHRCNPEQTEFNISGLSGLIRSTLLANGDVRVNMGNVKIIKNISINHQSCFEVDFGNPHLITMVNDVSKCDLESMKQEFTQDYPKGINFEIAEVVSKYQIIIRVFERGTGETLACGSGACATVAALQSTGILNNNVKVVLPGGNLMVEYQPTTKHLFLTGSAKHVFTGEIKI